MTNKQIWKTWLTKQNLSKEMQHKANELFMWITTNYPELFLEIKWNQPMFAYQKTFIIAFSCHKKHIAIAPEQVAIRKYLEQINECQYLVTLNTFKIMINQPISFDLLKTLIDFNVEDKKGYTTYFRTINC